MGKRNRERRRQKQRKRSRRYRPGRTGPGDVGGRADGSPFDRGLAEEVVVAAAHAAGAGDEASCARLLCMLHAGPPIEGGRALVDAALVSCLERAIGEAWRRGWQPADVVRMVERELKRAHGRVVTEAMATEARRYALATIDPRWLDQLSALGADPKASPRPGPARPSPTDGGAEGLDRLRVGVETLSLLLHLPCLPKLLPPPGSASAGRVGNRRRETTEDDLRLLDRVRALLAKAESTTFVEEAEVFTVKAQELMSRHAIDRAMLDAAPGGESTPVGRRVGVDDPYAQAKACLLDEVAGANECRSVWSKELGFATVFGHEAELDDVELLFTSLLVQATAAMTAAGPQTDRWGRSCTRSFRQSFLVAYASRIGARLREAAAAGEAAAAAEHGPSMLPVLAARSNAVDEAFTVAFPEITQRSLPVTNRSGWIAGLAAAELASLSTHQEMEVRPAVSA